MRAAACPTRVRARGALALTAPAPSGVLAALLTTLLAGCSENFGTAPLVPPGPVAVVREGFAGPIAARATTVLAGEAGHLWIGTDRGSYRSDDNGGVLHWWPGSADGAALPVVDIAGDPTGTIWLLHARGGGSDELRLSADGGQTFGFLPNPRAFVPIVERIGALPPSPHRPQGAVVAVQGVQLFVWPIGASDWESAQYDGSPAEFGAFAADAAGRAAVAVREGTAWEIWTSDDGAADFVPAAGTFSSAVLALAWRGDGALAAVTAQGVVAGADTLRVADARRVEQAALRARGNVVDYVLSLASDSLAIGRIPGPSPTLWALPAGALPEAGLVADSEGAWVATGDATVWRVTAAGAVSQPFDGGYLDYTAGAADPRLAGGLLLARGFGDTFRGAATSRQPDALGKFRVSNALTLLPDRGHPSAVFWGAFGVAWHPGTLPGIWEARSDGQSSYLQIVFAGPVQVTALAQQPADPLLMWLGAADGDGVYRSSDGGRNWARVHDGLGAPGAVDGENGLSGMTEVRAFAFVGQEIWMGGFRGGAHRLDPVADAWVQFNRGLPDTRTGAPLDTCCTVPLRSEVDVRDLVALPGGGLLAATGHGIYRDDARDGTWVASMQGLRNGDVYCLAPHPTRPGWVLAGCRGAPGAPEFLFLSRDAGLSWAPVATGLAQRWALKVMWTAADAGQLVAVLSSSGAWRMELAP